MALSTGSPRGTKRGREWWITDREVERYRAERLGKAGRKHLGHSSYVTDYLNHIHVAGYDTSDWRNAGLDDEPDDDEERPTPADVVLLHGYDPASIFGDE